uniref:PB1 domain-containing protein n=1 Tax=Setaria italica TaxID=4555 RepID=K4AF73_SETIT
MDPSKSTPLRLPHPFPLSFARGRRRARPPGSSSKRLLASGVRASLRSPLSWPGKAWIRTWGADFSSCSCRMADGGILVAICQYGGEFTSGPNGNLIYKGGEAHAVDVTRDMSLESFKDEVSKVFHVDVTDMSFKYFLPNNNRTLITISCDRDLQRMVDFTTSAAQVEVFLISRVENRSIVTYSGASAIKPGTTAPGDNKKRPPSKNK